MSVEVRPMSIFLVDATAILTVAGLVFTSPAPLHDMVNPATTVPPPPLALALTAQVLPLPLELVNEQIMFNAGLAENFVTTGAALAQRITAVPGALVADVRSGATVPAAAARALTAFADIEFEAGHDLIGYGQDIANFQIRFVVQVLSALPLLASGFGGRVVGAVSTWALHMVAQLANVARTVVSAAQQLTHNVLHTPLATTVKHVDQSAKIFALQPQSATTMSPSTMSPTVPRHNHGAHSPVTHRTDRDHPRRAHPSRTTHPLHTARR